MKVVKGYWKSRLHSKRNKYNSLRHQQNDITLQNVTLYYAVGLL